ncbi:hypothetical protein BBJ28_00007160 [Nothophytophthora sp. Chile5]|nr:hypothetical protein BBJ28_00007160 [Nothophytophthora sp. Chile5]
MREFDEPGVPSYMVGGARSNAPRMSAPGAAGGVTAASPGLQAPLPPGMGPPGNGGGCGAVLPNTGASSGLQVSVDGNWRQGGDEMRRLRSRHVVLIERMLRNHQPHDVLTQVPENYDWHSKTFSLAIKIERLMFTAATSRENYLNESTLRSRVQLLSRHLVRIRKRKNAMAASYETSV